MEITPNLALPYIMPSQAQKHVTHNEALRQLDAIVQLSAKSRTLSAPPLSPAEGDRYIVPPNATDGWEGQVNTVAAFQDGAWAFFTPCSGWIAWIEEESAIAAWKGDAWSKAIGPDAEFETLSVNGAVADETNRIAVSSPAALFDHAGGSHQVKINKNQAGETASLIFQTAYSGRAEFGLTGDDDWHVKVSNDGNNWIEALKMGRSDGLTAVKGLKYLPTGHDIASILFTPGGDGQISLYRIDSESAQNPRTAVANVISSDLITLSTPDAGLFFHSYMEGVALLRIWNISKSPEEAAWVKAIPDANRLQVVNAADIEGWNSGDVLQAGDPTTIVPNRCISLDISPMLTNLFGQAFPQKGIVVKSNILAGTGGSDGDSIAITPAGTAGSFVTSAALPSSQGVTMIACTELSPISSSNLVRVREMINGSAGVRLVSSIAILV